MSYAVNPIVRSRFLPRSSRHGLCPSAAGRKPPAAEVAGIPVNYDEALVGNYTLPDPLMLANGKAVRDAKTWNEKRRPEIVTPLRRERVRTQPRDVPPAMTLRRLRQGHPRVRRQSHSPPGDHLFLGRQGRPEDGPAALPARRRRRSPCPLLLNMSFSRQFQHGERSRRQAGRSLGPRQEERSRDQGRGFGRINVPRLSSTRASASPPSTTATSIPIFSAACPTACARSI